MNKTSKLCRELEMIGEKKIKTMGSHLFEDKKKIIYKIQSGEFI